MPGLSDEGEKNKVRVLLACMCRRTYSAMTENCPGISVEVHRGSQEINIDTIIIIYNLWCPKL